MSCVYEHAVVIVRFPLQRIEQTLQEFCPDSFWNVPGGHRIASPNAHMNPMGHMAWPVRCVIAPVAGVL